MNFGIIEIIVCLAGNLFSMYIINRFFQLFFGTSVSKKRKVFRAIAYTIYYCINNIGVLYFVWSPNTIVLTNIFGCTILSWSYIGSWKDRICAIAAIVTMSIVCEDTIYYCLISLHVKYIMIIGILATNLLFFMIVLLLQKFVDLRKGVEITSFEWIVVIIIPICSLLLSVVVLDSCKDEITVAFGGIIMIFVNVLLFFLLDRIQRMYRDQFYLALLEQQNLAYENQMKLLRSSEEKIVALRHDIKNHFIALNYLAAQNNCTKVQEYIDSLIPLTETHKKVASTGNIIVDSFLNLKLGEAVENGIKVNTDLKISKDIPVNPKDISIILGNLLDNSLRALKHCNKENKLLNIVMRQEQGRLIIYIENSHDETILKYGNVFKTTRDKKEGHGIGLKNVQQVVNEYQGQMEIDYTIDFFSVKLIIYF